MSNPFNQGVPRRLRQRGLLRALAIGLTSVALLTGCTSIGGAPGTGQQTAEPDSIERSPEQEDALLDYVEAERATIPGLIAAVPGVYSGLTVEASFETVQDNQYLPDGIHAVVWFDYTYVPGYDLAAAYRQIEAAEPEVKRLCESAIFPLMREFGVDPPYGVTFTYHAAEDTIGPLNTLSCSATR